MDAAHSSSPHGTVEFPHPSPGRSSPSKGSSLARAHVSEVVHPLPKKLVTLDASDSVERALDVLGAARVYAAPVLDGSGRFVGLLTKQDIVSFLLAAYPREDELTEDYFRTISFAGFQLSGTKCIDIVGHAKSKLTAPLVTGSCDLSVLFALQLLSTPDVLRIPVLNEAGAPVGVLSQFDLVRYLLHHHEHHVASCESLASLGLADRDSHSVSARGTDTVIACLRKMSVHNVNGLPVVDDNGHILFHFSQSDVRISADDFAWLSLPVRSAKDCVKGPVYAVTPTATLGDAMKLIVSHHIHAVHVVDAHKRLLRTLRLCDILSAFTRARKSSQ